MKREQGILIGTVIAAIIMMFLCSVFTFSDAVSEKALTTCIPESISTTEDGKTQYDWIVDYNSGEIIQLSTEYTSLSYKSSLAVTDNLVLNIDATNLENENWGDIIKHGDVKYSNENRALYFDGDGDYLELSKNADFSNGFTFEIYANLERLEYNNGSNAPDSLSLFCKINRVYEIWIYQIK